jgi:electron transfer flavoprotein beta subunit
MWFKEKQGATVHVATVGEASTEPTIRKALAIGADEGIRINASPADGYFVARQLAEVVKQQGYDLVICGRESIDYNGGMVPGIMAALLGMNFVNTCISLEVEGKAVTAIREIDGGKEKLTTSLPLVVAGQKGLVEESDLKIPNMRGIMMARQKKLDVVEPIEADVAIKDLKFDKPAPKGEVTLIDPSNVEKLVDLLHNEAKVI